MLQSLRQISVFSECNMSFLNITKQGPITRVRLNRAEVRNAFNAELIRELKIQFDALKKEKSTRVVILSGEGECFSAGADLNWMKSMAGASRKANEADAQKLSDLLETLDRFPKPLIGSIHGAAIGGGVGLVSVCDIVVASEETVFSLAEVKLGLIPAVISPYVIAKIGAHQARRYFLTGERFRAEEARRIGLVHEVVPLAELETHVDKMARDLLSSGPAAVDAAKALIRKVAGSPSMVVQSYTVKKIASLRTSDEGQEGMKAFLEKRKPSWNV